MADPFTAALVIVSVAGTAQQIRVTNAQSRIAQWQSDEEGKKAHLQSTEREVDRLKKLRRSLAQNNVAAASSGISLTSTTVEQAKDSSIKQFELDQLTDRANTESYVSNLRAASAANAQIAGQQNIVSGLQLVGTVVGATRPQTKVPVSEGG